MSTLAASAGGVSVETRSLAATDATELALAKLTSDGVPAALAARARADRLDHVVLAGMGGSSLAPEVITRTAGAPLTVLDTTDPHQVGRVLGDRLDRTLLVVSSKSGSTIETDSHRRIYEHALAGLGLTAAQVSRRIVVVSDPGSPLADAAGAVGYHVVLADPNVGG